MGQFATLDDVKRQINLSAAVDDDELTLMLDAAEEIVADIVGTFDAVAVTEQVTATGGQVLLSERPVGAVVLNGGTVTGFRTSSAGVLYDVPYGYAPLTATYTIGDGQVPARVTLATAIITAHLYETQRVPMQGGVDSAPPGFSGGIDATTPTSRGYALPNRAIELLRPHARQTSAL